MNSRTFTGCSFELETVVTSMYAGYFFGPEVSWHIWLLFSFQMWTGFEICPNQAARRRSNADFWLVRVGLELSITTSFPASKCGPLAKEFNGVRKSSLQLVTATLWGNFDFGAAALNQSLSIISAGHPSILFAGRYQWQIWIFWKCNLWLGLFDNLLQIEHFSVRFWLRFIW